MTWSQVTRQPGGKVAELRTLANLTADAALTADTDRQMTVLDAAKKLQDIADGLERREKKALEQRAVAELPANATANEIHHSRRRQATRVGPDVYLPGWSATSSALPNAFLRSALFAATRGVQADNANLFAGGSTGLVAEEKIGTFKDTTMMFSGHRLCQFDRLVYSTCLEYYREAPLCPEESPRHQQTTFYEFACRMGNGYSVKAHRAIRASLLRLSFAQVRLRHERINIEVPNLMSVKFDDDGKSVESFKGSDALLLRVTTSVAELFGPGAWTAVEIGAARYDGLRGWLANFYAGHAHPKPLPVELLHQLCGYGPNKSNFRASLVRALEKLKDPNTPACSRVASYHFSRDGTNIYVVRSAWVA
ncbi:plasmid replication initiator TrfA [Paraburkholderia sp. BCC1876]|uniref:plasmid replication initiator TrfA n=1 Tax=Paraburkholderia sp. BCC1876 TaxID=2676303 RepID=UPI00158FC158|nr:plasmid replication initiator TrfA [Paraburkholderia sp. BCC1876]